MFHEILISPRSAPDSWIFDTFSYAMSSSHFKAAASEAVKV